MCAASQEDKKHHIFLPFIQAHHHQSMHALAVSRPAKRRRAARRALFETARSGDVNSAKPDRKAALREPLRRNARPRGDRLVHWSGFPELLLLTLTAADTADAIVSPAHIALILWGWCSTATQAASTMMVRSSLRPSLVIPTTLHQPPYRQ
jgi:hypothetical protein